MGPKSPEIFVVGLVVVVDSDAPEPASGRMFTFWARWSVKANSFEASHSVCP